MMNLDFSDLLLVRKDSTPGVRAGKGLARGWQAAAERRAGSHAPAGGWSENRFTVKP